MKRSVIIFTALCFSTMVFSQEKSLFSNQEQGLLGNLAIERSDSSLLYSQLLNDKESLKNAFLIPDYKQIVKRKTFLESENSATKDVMPIYKPKGNFKQKSLFPDDTINYLLRIEPVKER